MKNFWTGIIIGIIIGALSLVAGVLIASAATAETTVTVVITDEVSSASVTAEVPCNEVNCVPLEQQEEEVGFFQSIINLFKSLI